MRSFINQYLPRSLFGRATLILVVPIVLLQVVVAGLFIQRHYAGVTEQMAGAVALELDYAVDVVDTADTVDEAQSRLKELARPLGLTLSLEPGVLPSGGNLKRFYDVSGDALADTLVRRVSRPMRFDLVSLPRFADIRIQTTKGVLRALIPRKRTIASNPHILLVWMAATAILLTVVAVVFLRNQIQPIRELASAAEDFGKGRSDPFRPRGAEEVRRAGNAFLDMRRRLERQMEQRTSMLSAVSHDLRTPLTRMKLSLAMSEDTEENRELIRDVDDMQHMLNEFLDFARGERGEPVTKADPITIAEEVASDARRLGAIISVSAITKTPENDMVRLRAGAVKRAVSNLVENARRYGDTIQIGVHVTRRALEISVEDDGPGIPEAEREKAFRAFTRLDDARNQDRHTGATGGNVGLGLSIALDVARMHGGSLTLEDGRELGGLRAILTLPR